MARTIRVRRTRVKPDPVVGRSVSRHTTGMDISKDTARSLLTAMSGMLQEYAALQELVTAGPRDHTTIDKARAWDELVLQLHTIALRE